jgi:signal peptide peptidase SppA
MTHFAHLAQLMFNRPLAIREDKAAIILSALAPRLGISALRLPDGRIRAFDDDSEPVVVIDEGGRASDPVERQGYDIISGVACIEVTGTLVQRQGGLRPWSGMTGYNAIRANLFGALADPAAKALVLAIDSPGGDCAGLFDLTDAIAAIRGKGKPIWAILDETAASAAYAIAAACDVVTVPRTGYTGSIGVIVLHADVSKMLDKEGITVSILQYGARKADGQPAIPLSDPARAALQDDIDAVGELFVSSVARYRNIAADKVRAQQARVFLGDAGVQAGLADRVSSPADAFSALLKSLK